MATSPRTAKSIFLEAVEKYSPDQWEAFLDGACAVDSELRLRAEDLLQAHQGADSLLDAQPATVDLPRAEVEPGTLVDGRYKLLQQIGDGGFGIVFMAEQQQPVKRKVALKVIKPGMDTKAVVARFEAERQALALMDHSNIAKVFDGGATENGRPYFVMELVKGVPITDYCDKNSCATRERLDLFSAVCQAVQHAHQKGIIHRDLKPSNVLVTLHDGLPVVKVIDFGVAKAINQQLTERTLFTAFGQMVGTPQYMSPEQAEMSGLDVDTRSDVYSLGVILYELLTGSTPLEAERLRTAGYTEMQRLIKEVAPPRPSNRLSTSGDNLTIIAKHRSVSPSKLCNQVRGDLDWIVMKCLEKDRNRRYRSANDLFEDVRRSCNNETVQARRPSRVYQARKFVRRNLPMVSAASVVLLTLVTGLVQMARNNSELMSIQAQLVQERDRARSLLAELNDELLNRALTAVVSGDSENAKRAIQAVAELETNREAESTTNQLAALAAIFSGRESEVSGLLEESTKANPENPATWALLFLAYNYSGDLDGMARAGRGLVRTKTKISTSNDFENLVVGIAASQVIIDVDDGVARLRNVVANRPSWAVARAMYAQSLAIQGSESSSNELIDEAIRQYEHAIISLPESAYVRAVGLQVYTTAFAFAEEFGQESHSWAAKADRISEQLHQDRPDYIYGPFTRATHFAATNRLAEAKSEFRVVLDATGSSKAKSTLMSLLVRTGEYPEAASLDMGLTWVEILQGNRAAALAASRDLSGDASVLGRFWAGYAKLLCGFRGEAEKDWSNLREEFSELPRWVNNPYRLFTGDVDESELVDRAKGSRFWTGHTYFCLATLQMAENEQERAIECLTSCIDAGCWMFDFHHMAIAMKERLSADHELLQKLHHPE